MEQLQTALPHIQYMGNADVGCRYFDEKQKILGPEIYWLLNSMMILCICHLPRGSDENLRWNIFICPKFC
jgi:hypothetical protein